MSLPQKIGPKACYLLDRTTTGVDRVVTEYRIGDLAQASGVTARNIRAYRERGLLDAPRRQGRVAWYDEHHLTQLTIINQLLAKGFNSAHIANFFDGIRGGHNLADVLGLHHGMIGAWQRSRRAGEAEVVADVLESTRQAVDELAARVVAALPESARQVQHREVAARLVSRRLHEQVVGQTG